MIIYFNKYFHITQRKNTHGIKWLFTYILKHYYTHNVAQMPFAIYHSIWENHMFYGFGAQMIIMKFQEKYFP